MSGPSNPLQPVLQINGVSQSQWENKDTLHLMQWWVPEMGGGGGGYADQEYNPSPVFYGLDKKNIMLLLLNTKLYNTKLFLSVFDEEMSQSTKIVKNWTYQPFTLIETSEYI